MTQCPLWPIRRPQYMEGRFRSPLTPNPTRTATLPLARPPRICKTCGTPIQPGSTYCALCTRSLSRETMIEAAKLGRIATHSPKAEALRRATQRQQRAAIRAWTPSDLPEWLTEECYREKIQPGLATAKISAIMSALGVSEPYATEIGRKKRVPHPRHWLRLAKLVGVTARITSKTALVVRPRVTA